jgi:hypothetical protein
VLREVREAGEGLLILRSANDTQGTLTSSDMPAGDWGPLADQADLQARLAGQAHRAVTAVTGSWVAAAMPGLLSPGARWWAR